MQGQLMEQIRAAFCVPYTSLSPPIQFIPTTLLQFYPVLQFYPSTPVFFFFFFFFFFFTLIVVKLCQEKTLILAPNLNFGHSTGFFSLFGM